MLTACQCTIAFNKSACSEIEEYLRFDKIKCGGIFELDFRMDNYFSRNTALFFSNRFYG